ncbi:MAG: hypothetical protein KJ915_08160 [Candidatus Omnitrophica bacterium]|nr:hypothetical protein [Candidatus Omnitrophota bacterium]
MNIPAIVKNEFYLWLERIKQDKTLNDTDKKLLNLIATNLDELYPLGRSQSKRAKRIGELIKKFSEDIKPFVSPVHSKESGNHKRVSKITRLEIGPFRGFRQKETFRFETQYTYMCGPNGSGKSSFCEGLEYALLGEIEECDAKRIPIQEYLQNVDTGNWEKPNAYGSIDNGEEDLVQPSSQNYRFCFIEKNRIDSFARLAATTPKDQQARISILFGLDAFHSFVEDFTDTLDDKHLLATNSLKVSFEEQQVKYKQNIATLAEEKTKLQNLKSEEIELIKKLGTPNIKNIREFKKLLDDESDTKGKISLLQDEKGREIPNNIDEKIPQNVRDSISHIKKSIKDLKKIQEKYVSAGKDVVFKALFNSIKDLAGRDDYDKSICPACLTPLNNVTKNPYENANEQHNLLKSLAELEEKIHSLAQSILDNSRTMNDYIQSYNTVYNIIKPKADLLPTITLSNFEIKRVDMFLASTNAEIEKIRKHSTFIKETKKVIKDYNLSLVSKREQYSKLHEEIEKLKGLRDEIITIEAREKDIVGALNASQALIDKFKKQNEVEIKRIEVLDKEIERNNQFRTSYAKIIVDLKKYRDSLPYMISKNIASKAAEFYNIINYQDPEFEKINELFLPSESGQKIEILFLGSENRLDALQILSEGHIRCLGLVLLLSKAVNEGLEILVFDDIVNAIDDDHRSGIIELLLSHEDLKDKQQIITCHGEEFVKNLELASDKNKRNDLVSNIQFIPPDIIKQRGVKIYYSDPKHYLELADRDYQKDNRRDALKNCRQAMENILEHFWKKLSKKGDFQLNVGMRSPSSRPEARSVLDGICKKLGKMDISKNINIKEQFDKLGSGKMWSMLNKGIHEEGEGQPEFERNDIKELIELLQNLERNVKSPEIITRMSIKKELVGLSTTEKTSVVQEF